MEEYTKTDTLHTGLITLDRKLLISPNHSWPELFTDTLDPTRLSSVESQARSALGIRGIYASTDRILVPHAETTDRGYLLRESSRIDVSDHGFATYTHDEVESFVGDHDPEDVRVHFFRQITKYMRLG